jgi:hypothetical protein
MDARHSCRPEPGDDAGAHSGPARRRCATLASDATGHATTDSRRLGIGSDHVQTVDGHLIARAVMLEGIASSGRSLAGPGRRSGSE